MIIKIKNLRLKTIIGIYDFEQKIMRDIIINASLHIKNELSLTTDDINDTIDYDTIVEDITKIVTQNKFNLIEKLANEVLKSILKNKKIDFCQIEVDKVKARNDTDSFAICLEGHNN